MIGVKKERFWKKWEWWSRTFRIIEFVAIIAGVAIALTQIRDVRNSESGRLMLEFNKELSTTKNSDIITAIEDNKPLFINNHGVFTEQDIDNYLGTYELLNNTFNAGLINNDMLYNAFSYDVVRTYDNQEIKAYLEKIRQEDPQFFMGFEELAISIKATN